jgi:hypothetical protein
MDPGEQPGTRHTLPEFRPPGTSNDPAAATTGNHGKVWMALAVMFALGLVVVLVLPQLVSDPSPVTPEQVTPQRVTPAAPAVDVQAARRAAEQALQDYLQLRARLELANAAAWGEPEWGIAAQGASNGDRLFGQRQFGMAAESYGAARQGLQTLESARGQRLATALESGRQALAADNGPVAVQYFETALAIDATNEAAQAGLQRAQVRPQLLQWMAAGEQAESANELAAAQAAYRDAAQLDPAWAPATAALQRVTEQLTDSAYRDAMSRALTALDVGQLQAARTALREAATLKPDDAALRDAQRQLSHASQRVRLSSLQRQASAKSRSEDWAAATALYRKALAIDAHAGFASDGMVHAEDRLRLHQQLDHYLADPALVYSEKPLANAEQLLVTAGSAPAAEPRLAGKIERLQQLVTGARTPLPVTLSSDGLTSVVIYHVGKFGEFTRQQLELLPGTYTAVGSRAGYRDVRRTITVVPGRQLPAIDIRCEEPV